MVEMHGNTILMVLLTCLPHFAYQSPPACAQEMKAAILELDAALTKLSLAFSEITALPEGNCHIWF